MKINRNLTLLAKGLHELKNARSFGDLEKTFDKIENKVVGKIFNTLSNFLVNKQIIDSGTSMLYIDTITGKDGLGIGDAIFSLPALEALSRKYTIDILTTQSRAVIFQGQNNINNVITDIQSISTTPYDILFLLHKSSAKYKFILNTFGIDGVSRTVVSNYAGNYYAQKRQNHIAIINNEISKLFLNKKPISLIPKVNLSDALVLFGKEFLEQWQGKKRIIFSVGYKDPKKNYQKLYQTIQLTAKQYPEYTFFLLGDETGKIQENQLSETNVVKCSGMFSLEQTFGVIAASDGIIGIDGGLTNAGIGLGKETFMIFNIIDPEDIVPPNYQLVKTIDVGCKNKCTYTKNDENCHNIIHAQCLKTLSSTWLYNEICSWIDKLPTPLPDPGVDLLESQHPQISIEQ